MVPVNCGGIVEQSSASLASSVKAHAQERGYRIDGAAFTRVNEIISAALRHADFTQDPVHSPPEARELQSGMVKFAEATIAAAAADDATMVGVAHIESAHAKVRSWGIFPFSGRRQR